MNVHPDKPAGWQLLNAAGLIVRWSWRGCSLAIFLCCIPLLLFGLPYGIKVMLTSSDWSLADVMVFVLVGLYVGGLALAWKWEWLGGALNCFILGIPALTAYFGGQPGDNELEGYVAWALALLILVSWSLNTLKDAGAKPALRWLALALLPIFILGIGYNVHCMPHAKFNP